jgi:hypothetical protein
MMLYSSLEISVHQKITGSIDMCRDRSQQNTCGKRSILITPQRRNERSQAHVKLQMRVHFRIPKAKKQITIQPLESSSKIVGLWKFGLVLPMVSVLSVRVQTCSQPMVC